MRRRTERVSRGRRPSLERPTTPGGSGMRGRLPGCPGFDFDRGRGWPWVLAGPPCELGRASPQRWAAEGAADGEADPGRGTEARGEADADAGPVDAGGVLGHVSAGGADDHRDAGRERAVK